MRSYNRNLWRKIPAIRNSAAFPLYSPNNKYLAIAEIAKDNILFVVPDYEIATYPEALLSPINHVFVHSRYVPTGVITSYDDKKLTYVKRTYLYLKFRFLNRVEHHTGEYLFAHDIWSNNYYHWLCEVVPRLLIMHKEHPQAIVILPSVLQKYPFITDTLNTLELPCKWLNTEASHSFSRLITVQCSPPLANIQPRLQRILKRALQKAMNIKPETMSRRKIYISRAKATYRQIDNEDEIIPVLIRQGYEIVYTETLSLREQIIIFSETAYCIALHGAGLTNLMFMQPGSKVMEIRLHTWSLQPLCYWRLANMFELNWSYHLAQPAEKESNFNNVTVNYKTFCEDIDAFHA